MTEERIICPKCRTEIPLSEALTSRIEERLRKSFEEQAQQEVRRLEDHYKSALAEERQKAREKVKEEIGLELSDLQEQLKEKATKLEEGQKRELELMRKQRELEDQKKNLDLELERRLQGERTKIEKVIIDRVTEEQRLKDVEKDKQLFDLRKQIDELRRKAEQGSQQTQGEAAELDLEATLRSAFPDDEILPVPKGVRGADLVQRVLSPGGKQCGTIAWEVKNTKAWSDGWLTKLRDDQRALKADLAVIVTTALPKDVKHFGAIEGIWVTDLATVLGLAGALRSQLLHVASARATAKGRGTKMELLYTYLTGTEFRQRVEAVVEAFNGLRDDLERERRAMETNWAKREKQIVRALGGLAGMYGDMQGIVGTSLPKVRHLELPAPEDTGEHN